MRRFTIHVAPVCLLLIRIHSAHKAKTTSAIVGSALKLIRVSRPRLAQIAGLICTLVTIQFGMALHADDLFFGVDTFDDGDATDGDPVVWRTGWDHAGADRRVLNGDFVHTAALGDVTTSYIESNYYDGISVRTTFTGDNQWAGVFSRSRGDNGYVGVLRPNGELAIHYVGNFIPLASAIIDVDSQISDVTMVMDTFGDFISLTAWETGQAKPDAPQVVFEDDAFESGGVGVWVGSGTAIFRSFEVSPEPFDPVPSPGDFNGDGLLNATDINMLVWESAAMTHDLNYDLTADMLVDGDDVRFWIKDFKKSWVGDSNLDGEFNSGDLVAAFTAGKYELDADADWTEGDWTGDHRFDSADLVDAFSDGGYEQGPRIAANAVPEPTSFVMLFVGLVGFAILRNDLRQSGFCRAG